MQETVKMRRVPVKGRKFRAAQDLPFPPPCFLLVPPPGGTVGLDCETFFDRTNRQRKEKMIANYGRRVYRHSVRRASQRVEPLCPPTQALTNNPKGGTCKPQRLYMLTPVATMQTLKEIPALANRRTSATARSTALVAALLE